jgi:hypothetical protein
MPQKKDRWRVVQSAGTPFTDGLSNCAFALYYYTQDGRVPVKGAR